MRSTTNPLLRNNGRTSGYRGGVRWRQHLDLRLLPSSLFFIVVFDIRLWDIDTNGIHFFTAKLLPPPFLPQEAPTDPPTSPKPKLALLSSLVDDICPVVFIYDPGLHPFAFLRSIIPFQNSKSRNRLRDIFGQVGMRIVLRAIAEEGTVVAWNGAACEAGGVLGGGVDTADETEEDEDRITPYTTVTNSTLQRLLQLRVALVQGDQFQLQAGSGKHSRSNSRN
ncbi:hypothetical protein F5146DRAFT_1222400 [Armillaria mellea]|nr:hypothetical protein F5146DRAFT_1222400 [Armillaria mellea]